jgi:LDH2 family malate/lactate/ureidoglycolate dehydrogenase
MTTAHPADELKTLASDVLVAAGTPEDSARLVADGLVAADARGMASHGLMRLPTYVRRILAGGIDPAARGTVVREGPSTVLIDGQNGLGHVVATFAVNEAVRRARATGVCVAGVRNSNHFGEAAHFLRPAIDAGMIAIVATTGSANMPPWGGTTYMIGTLPLAIGIPSAHEKPIELDMALGAVSKGKILNAAREGRQIPAGWGVDREGKPTTDPHAVLDGGWVSPIGGHKGFGLIVALEALSGALTGAAMGTEIGDLYGVDDQPQRLGHAVIVIDVDAFVPVAEFTARMDASIRRLRSSDLAPGFDRILMPGEIEQEIALSHEETGIPVPDGVIDELRRLLKQLTTR